MIERLSPLAALAPFLRPYRLRILAALVALVVAAGATLTLPIAFRNLIDLGFSAASRGHIDAYFLALFGVALVLAFATAARFYSVSWLGERVTADLRAAVYDNVIRMSPEFFESTRTGEVLSRLTSDTTLVETVVGTSFSMGLRNLFLLVGGLVMLGVTSPQLTAYIGGLLVAVVAPLVIFGRRVRKLSRASQDSIADTSALAGEMLGGIATVQAYTHEGIESARYRGAVEKAFATSLRRIRARSLLTVAVISMVFGAVVLVLWLGAQEVLAGRMSGGALGAFVLYAVLVAGALGALAEVWGDLARAAGAMERLLELYRAKPAIVSAPDALPLAQAHGHLRFEHVGFHYPSRPETPALAGIGFEVRPGETVALVGPSGAGKTTILQLLMRFYDPQGGEITLDGIPLRDMARADFRAAIALVPQDPVIFAASARDNIRFGRPTASDAEVEEAARAAAAHDFLTALPQGYDTFLGERGVMLSGGQRQRVAIARAILRDAPVLLLDEATSALDAESEGAVQAAVERLSQGRTTLVVAHRLATVKRADRIVVFDQGRIAATGTHDELVAAGGLYARLARLQFTDGAV